MLAVATLGNERNVVAIGTYYNNLPLIATDVVVAIDQNPCSESREEILKISFEFEYMRKFDQIICAVVLIDRGQQYYPIAKRIN
jgi:hypothetical protein